jgi:hypothetical protein
MYKNKIFVIAFGFFASFQIYATAQYSDIIIYNGTKYPLNVNPLEPYFEKNPEKRPEGGVGSTALWRGYVATFEISNNKLILKDMEIEIFTGDKGHYKTEWKSIFQEFVLDNNISEINWFTGLLVIPNGELINYIHMGYASTYENYILLEIRNGNFFKERRMNHIEYTKYKNKQFEQYKKTENYREKIKESLKEGYSAEFAEDFLKIFEIDYTTRILDE